MEWEKIDFPWHWMKDDIDRYKWEERTAIFEQFVELFGFTIMSQSERIGSYERLLNGKRSYNNVKDMMWYPRGWKEPEIPPNDDHARLFKKQGTSQIVYVNQPYEFDLEELEKWCNERNLIYVVCDTSWSFYYPNNTEMILIMSEDTYVGYIEKIQDFPRILQSKRVHQCNRKEKI